ncbi:MAG: hypothetical protein HRT61_00965 [Ekhidna sp.]|nr:hypothetical protein [Ekhidna sp.]
MTKLYTTQRIENIRKNGPFFHVTVDVECDPVLKPQQRLWQGVLNFALADYLSGERINKDDPECSILSWEEYLTEANPDFEAVCSLAGFNTIRVLDIFTSMEHKNPYK